MPQTQRDPMTPLMAVVSDVDGVLTRTAELHREAWSEVMSAVLDERRQRRGAASEDMRPFEEADYRGCFDGLPRHQGIRNFAEARAIDLPEGDDDDPPEAHTVRAIGRRKDARFHELLEARGVGVWHDAVAALERWRRGGLQVALVSSSRNCRRVLQAAGLLDRFAVIVDGEVMAAQRLADKSEAMIEAARRLGVEPANAAVLEDAEEGVRAARQAGFGRVIGVDRSGGGPHAGALANAGADEVHADIFRVRLPRRVRRVGEVRHELERRRDGRPLAVFLDFDGTLSPIVDVPSEAALLDGMGSALEALRERFVVAVVSGRDRAELEARVGVAGIAYAGSHGLDIKGPGGLRRVAEEALAVRDELEQARQRLERVLEDVPGAEIELKAFALAAHYRRVADGELPRVREAVAEALACCPGLRIERGKRVFELRPDIDWDKGDDVRWLMEALGVDPEDTLPIYIGDDTTDEDAFAGLRDDGVGIRVGPEVSDTLADWTLADPAAVAAFLRELAALREPAEREPATGEPVEREPDRTVAREARR